MTFLERDGRTGAACVERKDGGGGAMEIAGYMLVWAHPWGYLLLIELYRGGGTCWFGLMHQCQQNKNHDHEQAATEEG